MFQPVYAIQLGNLLITPHGITFALGALFAAFALANKPGIRFPLSRSLEMILTLFAIGLFGARLAYLLSYPGEWVAPLQVFAIWEGGLVSYGGIIAVVLVAVIYGRRLFPPGVRVGLAAKLSVLTLAAWSVGRLGNFIQGESGGVLSDFWTWSYGRVPIQLFEAIGCVALAAYGFILLKRDKESALELMPWAFGASYLLLRFGVDIWRDEAMWHGLHSSQWAALVLLVILVITYVITSKKSLLRAVRPPSDNS